MHPAAAEGSQVRPRRGCTSCRCRGDRTGPGAGPHSFGPGQQLHRATQDSFTRKKDSAPGKGFMHEEMHSKPLI